MLHLLTTTGVLAESWMDFYNVQGLELKLPHLYISGNPPEPTRHAMITALVAGAVLLIVLSFVYRRTCAWEAKCGPPRWRRVLLRVALVAAFFVAWEVALQFQVSRSPYMVYAPDPILAWTMNPEMVDYANRNHNGIVGVNSRIRGIFDTAYGFEKDPGVERIIVYGDSQVLSVTPRESIMQLTYPKVVERILAERLPDTRIEVVNSGLSGYSSLQGLLLLRNHGLRLSPDLVIFAFGYHDSNLAFSPDRAVLTDNPAVHTLRTWLYRSQIFLLIRKLLMRRKAVQLEEHPERAKYIRVSLEEFAENLGAAAALGRKKGFRMAFLLEPIRADADQTLGRTAPFREQAREVARREGALLIDGFTPFANLPRDENMALFNDEIHLNAAGHRFLAVVIAGALEPGLRRPPAGSP